ncbi:glycosyl transferase [Bacteroidia bacterium]|nr:glycosyl transferase [Bacteroidia bacterium]GHT27344.1 glycosyl transferase [Bacteroidia bacterium]
MRILLANKFYYHRGGDCTYTINLESLLKQYGHEVALFAMQYPENIETPWSEYFPSEVKFSGGVENVKAALRPFGTGEVKQAFNRLLDDFKPDIVHLNNIHSQLSPVVAEIAKKRDIRVVWTLHDYKLLCPRYDCLRNENVVCKSCFTDKKQVLKNRCMKNSLSASIIAYLEAVKWNRQQLETSTDVFICPSRFMYDKMIQGGFNPEKLCILPNCADIDKAKRENYCYKEDYYCYLGRISHEKGVETLVNAAKQLPYHLKIIGGGPLKEILEEKSKEYSNIEFLGYKYWEDIKEIVGKARFTVIPSEWYENYPLSIIESLCLGTPVLGANIGGIPEMIEEGKTGMLFESRNVENLRDKIQEIVAFDFDYKWIAEKSQQRYSGEIHYKKVMDVYHKNNL